MLLEVVENKIVVDKAPYFQDLRCNVDSWKELIRLKLKFITPDGLEPVDLAISYSAPRVSISSASISIKIYGEERTRKILFETELTFSLIQKSFYLKGTFGDKIINQKIRKISEVLEIIKSQVTTIIDK